MVLALVLLAACKKPEPPAPPPEPVPSPVAAPADLALEVTLRGPDALWMAVQDGVKGPIEALPRAASGLLATLGPVDVSVTAEIDGAQPAYGVVATPGGVPTWALAMKLRDPRHARAALVLGTTPRWKSHAAGAELTVLELPAAASSAVVALSSLGYLVVAPREADLTALAPYATHNLPQQPLTPHALVVRAPAGALAGPIRDGIRGAWAKLRTNAAALDASLRSDHGGRTPDFGDPQAVLAGVDAFVDDKLAAIAGLSLAVLTVDTADDALVAEVTLTPGAGPAEATFRAMATGDASPLMTLSRGTTVALLTYDDPASLEASSRAMADRVEAVLKPALDRKATEKMRTAFTTWGRARGRWMTVGLELEEARALTLRAPVRSGDDASRAVGEFVDLVSEPGWKDLARARFGIQSVSTAEVSVSGGGSTSIATLHGKKDEPGDEPAVAWAVTEGLLHVAASKGPSRALRASKEPDHLLGSDARLAAKLGSVRDRASFVVTLRPGLTRDPDARRPSAVLAFGRDRGNGWGSLDIDDGLIREALDRSLSP